SGRSQEQKVTNRTARRVQPGEEHLVNFGDFLDGRVLADDFAPESGFEILRCIAAPRWIQGCVESGLHDDCRLPAQGPDWHEGTKSRIHKMDDNCAELFYLFGPDS